MKQRIFMFSIVVIFAGIYFTHLVYRDYLKINVKIKDEMQRIATLTNEVESLIGYADGPIKGIDQYINSIHGHFTNFSLINDSKNVIDLSGIQGSTHFGIRQMLIKVSFVDIKGVDENVQIFQFLGRLVKVFPLDVTAVSQVGNNLQINMIVYGA